MKNGFRAALGALSLASAILAASAPASAGNNLGATWWGDLEKNERVSAVLMLEDGYLAGSMNATAIEADRLHVTRKTILEKVGKPSWSHTVDFYESAITDFYERHENASAAPVAVVFGCLRDHAPDGACEYVAKAFSRGE